MIIYIVDFVLETSTCCVVVVAESTKQAIELAVKHAAGKLPWLEKDLSDSTEMYAT